MSLGGPSRLSHYVLPRTHVPAVWRGGLWRVFNILGLIMRYLFVILAAALCHPVFAGELVPQSFTWGVSTQVSGVGQVCRGLARRADNGNFLTVGQAGNNPFNLYEFSFNGTKCTLVKNWGAINTNDQLRMAGRALVQMRGLRWDDNSLLCSYGTFYSNGNNTPFLCRVVLNADGTKTVAGPWGVPSSIHSDTTKGNILRSPCAFTLFTGDKPYLAFGSRGSTAQLQSWGFGLVALSSPDSGVIDGQRLVHWPMRIVSGASFSDYPRDPADGPTIFHTSPTAAGVVVTGYSQIDGIHTLAQIDDYYVATGFSALGRIWYGQKGDMVAWPSALDPTKPTMGVSNAHGFHCEGYRPKLYIYSMRDIVAGVATGNERISHRHMTDLSGIVPVLQSAEMTGMYYDAMDRKLYLIDPGLGTTTAPMPVLHVLGVN